MCFLPSVCVQVGQQLSFGCAVKAYENFFLKVGIIYPEQNNILEVLVDGFVSPVLQGGDIDKITI